MLAVVVVFNVLLSLLCFYVAWQVWNFRRALAVATQAVALFELNTHNALYGAPDAISQGQSGVSGLRASYRQLEIQRQRVQQVLALLSLLQRVLPMALRSSSRVRQGKRADALLRRSRLRRLRRQRRSRR